MQFDSFPATHGGFVPQMQKKDTLLVATHKTVSTDKLK